MYKNVCFRLPPHLLPLAVRYVPSQAAVAATLISFDMLPATLRAVSAGAVVLLASTVALAAPHCARASNTSYSAIVAFGDSFTDNGELLRVGTVETAILIFYSTGSGAWAASNHTWPANPN